MGKIVFLDVDGTLIDYEGKIPDSAREAIVKARQNGHKVFICTGCSKCEIESKKWDFELDGIIGGNGCFIEEDGKIVYHKTLTYDECVHFVDWCKQRDLTFRLECNSGMYLSEDYEEKSKVTRIKYIYGQDVDVKSVEAPALFPHMIKGGELYRDDVNKTAFILKSYQDYLDACIEFKGLKVGTWGGKGELALYGDVGVQGVSKSTAIAKILEIDGYDKSDAIGFGDAAIDIPMFEACGYSVAMGNGSDQVKEAADYVTDDIHEDGLYNAFHYLGLFERK